MTFQLRDLYPLLVLAFYAKQFCLDTSWFPFLEVWANDYSTPAVYSFNDYCKLANYIWQTYRYDVHVIRECGSWLCIQSIGTSTDGYEESENFLSTMIKDVFEKLKAIEPSGSSTIAQLSSMLTKKLLYNELIFVHKRGDMYFMVAPSCVTHCTDIKRSLYTEFERHDQDHRAFAKIKPILAKFGIKATIYAGNCFNFRRRVSRKLHIVEVYDKFVCDWTNPFPDPTIDEYCEQLTFLMENGFWPVCGPTQEERCASKYICAEHIVDKIGLLRVINEVACKYNCDVSESYVKHGVDTISYTPYFDMDKDIDTMDYRVIRKATKHLKFIHSCKEFLTICKGFMRYFHTDASANASTKLSIDLPRGLVTISKSSPRGYLVKTDFDSDYHNMDFNEVKDYLREEILYLCK